MTGDPEIVYLPSRRYTGMPAHEETSSCEEIKDSREIKGCEEVNSAVLGKEVLAKRSRIAM